MKLAEALILRPDYQRRIEQLKRRLLRNAKVQEGDKPAENPKELAQELEQVSEELQQLIQRINKTNSRYAYAPPQRPHIFDKSGILHLSKSQWFKLPQFNRPASVRKALCPNC
jgi:hypothetical protein